MNECKNDLRMSDMLDAMNEEWSNAACCGYIIEACKSMNFSKMQILNLLKAVNAEFSNITVENAKKIYYDF